MNDHDKRTFLKALFGAAASLATAALWTSSAAARKTFEVVKSDAEWRKILSPMAYRVLRDRQVQILGVFHSAMEIERSFKP